MRAGLKKIIKMAAAAIIGLALLDLFCAWYYNPADYVQDEAWATDVVRRPGAFTSRANEGFSSWTIDENGYVNREVPGEDGVFVLMMGSSHAEGLYVQPGEDVSSQLAEKLRESGVDGFVYNIGMSGHDLTRNVFNLDRALTRFAPTGYVVIETRTVRHTADQVYSVLNGSLWRTEATEVVLGEWFSGRPLVRTIVRQLLNLRENEPAAGEEMTEAAEPVQLDPQVLQSWMEAYEEAMTELMQMVRDAADAHGVTPIVYYHPPMWLQEDGTVSPNTYDGTLEIYERACERAGVYFLDLTDAFLEAYETERILPHGFINTKPEYGHLNAGGSRIAAEAICAKILELEAAK